ncbi:MAG: nucleoside 2-deoxyribosyltransferase [Bacteroidales bacterium]|nr:nucleoside 2-deoxyribosyltransferase [Bacteroidales bacterium]MBN2697841.1 nucleoside 2-deoxyribosyltransferase [Bacteroidales bacterium]
MLKIYFCGSISGGRAYAERYREIIRFLKSFGQVPTEHIGDNNLTDTGGEAFSDNEIYERDMNWLNTADLVVAEVTVPSIGVGFEIGCAVALNKPVLALFDANGRYRLSAMISGNGRITNRSYRNIHEVEIFLKEFISLHDGDRIPGS